MNKPKFLFKVFLFLLVFSTANVFAQNDSKLQQADTCYEVVLQIVVASNNTVSKNTVPSSLSDAVKKLKTLYAYSDYRVTTTFLQRVSNTFEYKSILNDLNQNADKATPVFSEWELRGLKKTAGPAGRGGVQFDLFRFGARVPVIMNPKTETEKNFPMVAYEGIGVLTTKLSLNENEPTIVGSLATSKSDELMFLILTVKPVSD